MQIFGSSVYNATQYQVTLPKSTIRELVIQFRGTNASGQAIAVTELGRIALNRNGKNIIDCDLSVLNVLNNCDGGFPQFSSTTGGAVEFQCRIPFYIPDDLLNCAKFGEGEAFVQLITNATGVAKLTAGSWTFYLRKSYGIEKYIPKILDFSQTFGASGSTSNPILNDKNVFRLIFMTATDTTNIILAKDGFLLVSSDTKALQYLTAYENRLESLPSFVVLTLNPSHAIAEMISGQLALTLTSGLGSAGTSIIYYQAIEFTPNKTLESTEKYLAFQTEKLVKDAKASDVVRTLTTTPPVVRTGGVGLGTVRTQAVL